MRWEWLACFCLLNMAAGSGGGMFAQATRRAAEARFKQRDVDAEGQEIDVRGKRKRD